MAVIPPWTGTLPSKGQAPTVFNANVTAFIAYIAGLGPEINTAIAEILVGADVEVWATGVYNPPTIVAGSDGNRYACIATTASGDDPVGSVTGDWVRLTLDTTAMFPIISAAVPKVGDIRGNDSTVSGNVVTFTAGSCKDSTDTVSLYSAVSQNVTIPSVANTRYYLFKVRLVADASCEHRAYTTLAGPSADAQIDAYRLIDYWETNGSNACKGGFTVDGIKYFSRFTENTINSHTDPPAGITTAISMATVLPLSMVSSVAIGAQANTNDIAVYLSGISGVVQGSVSGQVNNRAAGERCEWGAGSELSLFLGIPTGNLYWGESNATSPAGTVQLAVNAVKLRI